MCAGLIFVAFAVLVGRAGFFRNPHLKRHDHGFQQSRLRQSLNKPDRHFCKDVRFYCVPTLYTGFWIFAIFIKAALLIYCAAVTLPGGGGHKGKCLGAGLAAFAVSCALGRLMTVGQHSPLITVVPFAVFSSLIPLVWLLRHRKARGTNETNN